MADKPNVFNLTAAMAKTLQQHAEQMKRVNESLAAQRAQFAQAAEALNAQQIAFAKSLDGPLRVAMQSLAINKMGVLNLAPIIDQRTSEQLRRSITDMQIRLPSSVAERVLSQTEQLRGALSFGRDILNFESAAASAARRQMHLSREMLGALSRLAESVAIDQSLHFDRTLAASVRAVIDELPEPPAASTTAAPFTKAVLAPKAAREELEAWLSTKPAEIQWITVITVVLLLELLRIIATTIVSNVWQGTDSPNAMNVVINEIHQYNIQSDSVDLRCVNGKGVRVRAGPSTEYSVIDHLAPGHPVAVLEVQGNFAHVHYRDPFSGESRTGWAARSYLVKMVCQPKD